MGQELIYFVIIVVVLSSCLIVAQLIQKHMGPPPEVARKIVHLLIGTVSLSFPFLFKERLTVLILATIMFSVVLTLRLIHYKKQQVGRFLYSVERSAKSIGELVFPIAIGSTFWMAKGDPLLYFIPILILTYADTVAAIVGTRIKKGKLSIAREDEKSLVGSIAFVLVAFLCTFIILNIYSSLSWVHIFFLALIIGTLTALVEATSSFGLDNLLIPLLCYAFLFNQLTLSQNYLLLNLLFIIAFFIAVYKYRHIVDLSKLAIMETVLATYITILVGGIRWGIAPIIVLVLYPMFPRRTPEQRQLIFNKHVIESNIIVGVIFLFFATLIEGKQQLFMVFYLVFGLHIALNTYGGLRGYHGFIKKKAYGTAFAKGSFLLGIGAIVSLMEFGIKAHLGQVGLCFIILLLILGIAAKYLDKMSEYNRLSLAMAWKQTGLVAAGTLIGTLMSYVIL